MDCEKMQKTILIQNGQFWTVFGQNGQNGNFFKKALEKFLSLTNCKVSEKIIKGFRETASRTDERTDKQIDVIP